MTTIPAPASNLDRFFAALHRSPVTRSSDRALAGVCSGVADQFGVSVKMVRIITVLLAIAGAGVPLYLIAWLLLPDRTGTVHLERAIRHGQAGSIALLVVTILALLPDGNVHRHHDHGGWGFIPVLIIAAVLFARSRRGRARRYDAPAGSRRSDGPQDVLR